MLDAGVGRTLVVPAGFTIESAIQRAPYEAERNELISVTATA